MRTLLFVGALIAGGAHAAPLESSLRPVVRATPVEVVATTRPEPALMREAPNALVTPVSVYAASASLRPELRPKAVVTKAMAQKRERRRGSVCGDLDIQGSKVGFVPGRINGCGVKDAVKISSVSGVGLSQQSVMDCSTAKALKTWMDRSAKPALKRKGGGLDRIKVAAHYACRTRNNRKGAKISEHGKGRAIDISGFYLRDGSLITVLKGWNAAGSRKALRTMHKGACGPFGTVLGPQSDRFHRDHFHFDTARYRSGPFCR
jgi:hypothetical protein